MSSRPIIHVLTPNDLSNHFIQDLGSKKIKLDESVVKAWLTEVLDSVGLSTESVSQELMSKVSLKSEGQEINLTDLTDPLKEQLTLELFVQLRQMKQRADNTH